jgi:hypothetical protein
MPARKRRGDLTIATAADARAQARVARQIASLHEAAARALRLHDWQAAAKHGGRPASPEPLAEPAAAPARPRNGLRWPFGRKPDPEAERRTAILAELEASVAGRPHAGDAARAREAEVQPAAEPLRAAG